MVLSTRNIHVNQHLPSKLCRHWIGPYQVARVISPVAYGLDLPPTWWIHPVFHVSNLKRFHRSEEFEREERPPSPIVVDGEEEYEMEAILRHKGKGTWRLYLVMWKGYPIAEASWEPELHLGNAPLIWRITCATSEPRISNDVGTKEAGKRVDGGPEEYKATGVLRLKDQCLMGGNRVRRAEPAWMVL